MARRCLDRGWFWWFRSGIKQDGAQMFRSRLVLVVPECCGDGGFDLLMLLGDGSELGSIFSLKMCALLIKDPQNLQSSETQKVHIDDAGTRIGSMDLELKPRYCLPLSTYDLSLQIRPLPSPTVLQSLEHMQSNTTCKTKVEFNIEVRGR